MAMDASEIKDLILKSMPDAEVMIEDLAGDGEHYRAVVIDASFSGMTRVQQHKKVYDALEGKAGTTLHALALTTKSK